MFDGISRRSRGGAMTGITRRAGSSGRLKVTAISVAVALAVGVPATASTASAGGRATAAAAVTGTVLGGDTSQGWPVVVQLNKAGNQVVRALAGVHLTCTSGGVVNLPDHWSKLTVSRSGRFAATFGPSTQRNQDGTTTDFAGAITGKLNKARTTASGTWQFKATEHDTAGAVTDTCDSGTVRWSAKA
jgi:hypothetical protein